MNWFFDDSIADNMNNPPRHIKGIACSVKNCKYNGGEGYCTAESVSIGPGYAESCTDTACATFKKK